MGRRKIEIKYINDDRNRSVTFIKRKNGLFKKAHELSILTGAKVTVHVEDIKERRFDFVSANLGGENAQQHFASDEDDDDANSNDPHDELNDGELHESASSAGSVSLTGSKRDSGAMRSTHRRSQSSLHLSPNPNVSTSRRSSGHPYPRSPNMVHAGPTSQAGRPASMDFSLNQYGVPSQTSPAAVTHRKLSAPTIGVQSTHGQLVSPGQMPYPHIQPQQQQQPSRGSRFYFHPNQSHPVYHNSQFEGFPQQPQHMPRYNGNLFQANGHPATHSQQHIPAYPSNLVPNQNRHSTSTLPSSKEDPEFVEFGGSLEDYMDDDLDPEFDHVGTQASTPGNYDFSTNPSLTNLNTNITAGSGQHQQQQNRFAGIGLGMHNPGMHTAHGLYQGQQVQNYPEDLQQQQRDHHQHQQQQQQAQYAMGFYNNPIGAQSTPNLAWTLTGQTQMSPQER